MVMDATQSQQPSPQSVGREFVRQYYTLLNKAPNHLHRFYNNNSSFIHGESTLVVGQRDIHNRIQQLNFNDCHAKISQVDAQATLGQGVVVQVTGELSNDGQPMRRFTQTFVLAAQSPKKYYVHNDIFRYQDLYIEDEQDGESRSENDEEHDIQVQVGSNVDQGVQVVGDMSQPPPQQQQLPAQAQVVVPAQQVAPTAAGSGPQPIFYPMPQSGAPAGRGPVPVLPAAPQAAAVPLPAQFANQQPIQNGVVSHEELQQQQQGPPQALVQPSASPLIQQQQQAPSGAPVLPTNVGIVPVQSTSFQQSPLVAPQLIQPQQHQPQQLPPQQQQQAILPPQQQLIEPEEPVSAPINVQSTNEVHTNTSRQPQKPSTPVDDFKTIHEQQQQEKYEAAKQQQNEPKTYANLFKSTSSSPSGFVNAALQQQQQLHQQQQQSINNSYNNSSSSTTNSAGGNGSGQVSYSTTASSYNNSTGNNNGNSRLDNGGPLPQRNNSIRNNKGDFEQRRPSNAQQFGDNQQLFLGNIPHHASEDELREIFSRFGNVIELRILSKSGNKVPPGIRSPLNYGFITYDDSEAVQKCLANCPLYFPENSPDGQKLNVEEKKPRMRNDMAPRQPIGGGNNLNNNMGRIGGGNNGPQSRPMGNGGGGGGMMRNTGGSGGNMRAGGGGGNGAPRLGGGGGGGSFGQRNDNRGSGNQSNGPLRGSGNGQSGGGGNYGRR
ncbi:uncharacterized protein Dwil_GK13947 [Drosophila willistoni]|uniref:Rasputin n=1 Tax=Drosophila willistoni TaxID=7260 RepID=B4NKF2_DROWI|nr:ras GTPase-activating protein-binding protein 2 [Drosophila willistoni]XP_046866352.1 ras GTPase-activating protein-binding protein 2 [Drosophila willistoni]XP_046866355.1 ras GTPase-activating protein-binding protein 2 [Drosophila willistoni]EDW84082.1 uncharacterized protein Dwil_GK13947 [Drosophila willistoni]